MELLKLLLAYIVIFVGCEENPNFNNKRQLYTNHDFIDVAEICGKKRSPLHCRTNDTSCCYDSDQSQWIDLRSNTVVQNMTEEKSCLYVTREHESLSLNCKTSCTNLTTSGMWGCDITGSSGERQSIYIYIGNNKDLGKVHLYINTC